jgi:hypothetical protein
MTQDWLIPTRFESPLDPIVNLSFLFVKEESVPIRSFFCSWEKNLLIMTTG